MMSRIRTAGPIQLLSLSTLTPALLSVPVPVPVLASPLLPSSVLTAIRVVSPIVLLLLAVEVTFELEQEDVGLKVGREEDEDGDGSRGSS